MIKDLSKEGYSKFDNLINISGELRDNTIYSIPIGEITILDQDGNNQIELLNITFQKGTHIEEVRRSMNKWADIEFVDKDNDSIWIQLGFYELVSDGIFRKMVATKGSMTQ